QQICQEAQERYELSHSDARRTEFRSRNRYKDISPFDHSRIRLEYNNIDYINASRVDVPEAQRSYILTQGPLAITFSHFWLMCWEKQSSCIVMLNKLVEKKQVKCHPYFPTNATKPMILKDVGLKITLLSRVGDDGELLPDNEDPDSDANSKQFRIIKHFHFTAWPDFGIPESPEIFLKFLFSIRDEGLLNDTANHPPIIHCSAGVGRSGAFCLVDACLSIVIVNVNLRSTLLNMRRYRMALIQAPSQLKFSYQATVDGLK
ncbi:hypothetical protein HELRODRAFT_119705, partial [Helobdella robusta]|uniref:protein-tyrosine-phosphatase n=1 Tax=Helobdella robusta TaxID=6412 RepID=T1EGN5_HELRO